VRDDIEKLPLSKSTKRYARMTSTALGQNWSRKVDMFMDMVADTTGQEKEGFRNRDAAGKVPHSMKGMAEDVVESLLEGLYRAEGDYYYVTCCVGSTAEKIHAMVDAAKPVSKTEFFKNVPLKEVFNSGIAQIYAWTPAQCRAAGVDYEEVRQNRGGLKMWNDWAIGYYKSVYDGQECYYFDHSRIEYIFCKA
jgi:hypothetical protein